MKEASGKSAGPGRNSSVCGALPPPPPGRCGREVSSLSHRGHSISQVAFLTPPAPRCEGGVPAAHGVPENAGPPRPRPGSLMVRGLHSGRGGLRRPQAAEPGSLLAGQAGYHCTEVATVPILSSGGLTQTFFPQEERQPMGTELRSTPQRR